MTSANRSIRAVRGATTVDQDDAVLVCDATRELLHTLLVRNAASPGDVISAIFSVSPDLRSEFPARAARDLGWEHVAMLCTTEMSVPGAIRRCIRVLLHMELTVPQHEVRHTYLREANVLRPDLAATTIDVVHPVR